MESFQQMTADITNHPLFLQLRACPHHGGKNSLYIHSVSTARIRSSRMWNRLASR